MHILLTNDDGLRAPGIEAMHAALIQTSGDFARPLGDVTTIAPLTVQSATSHGVTFHEPLMIREENVNPTMSGIAVDGRPADCVKLAIASLWPEKFGEGTRPDLLISGMNAGANAGINVIYSGTVAAALEAAFLGIPSIAVSLHIGPNGPKKTRFDVAARHARRTIEQILSHGPLTPHTCLSINVPITEADVPMYPVRVCRMNTHGLVDKYERRVSPAGDVYYWAAGYGLDFRTTDDETDVAHLMARHITVTPLRYDLTKKSILLDWKRRLEGDRE